jgi:cell division septum initiation protein DivIVA
MLLELYGEDFYGLFEESEQIEEEIEKLQENLNEAKKEKVKNRSVIANISCLEVEISDLQSRIC